MSASYTFVLVVLAGAPTNGRGFVGIAQQLQIKGKTRKTLFGSSVDESFSKFNTIKLLPVAIKSNRPSIRSSVLHV